MADKALELYETKFNKIPTPEQLVQFAKKNNITVTLNDAKKATTEKKTAPKENAKPKSDDNTKVEPTTSKNVETKPQPESVNKNGNTEKADKHDDESDNTRTTKTTESTSNEPTKYVVGDEVLLSKERCGIVRFVGTVHFQEGVLYGIEVTDGSIGKSDGSVDGKRYFTTEPNRALFVVEDKIRRKMTEKDHKKVGSYHNLAATVKQQSKDDTEQSVEPTDTKSQTKSDNTTTDEQQQSDEQQQQPDDQPQSDGESQSNGQPQSNGYVESSQNNTNIVTEIGEYTFPPAQQYENLLSFIMSQKGDIRELLLDLYANPTLNQTMCETWKSLKQINETEQKQVWPALLSRWKKHI